MKWFKSKKQKALEEENGRLLQKLSIAEKRIEVLEEQLDGKRVTSPYCKACNHGIPSQTMYGFGQCMTTYLCSLNCPCHDYERKETDV